ncbi:hypothetical protein [Actinomadura yumaensis]|uniref:ANTAR domain-containing protein n=1 Tax=Actinomadura yumaensis TaxID=111807 RepID=A0ABW2CPT4_9ACTN
MTLFESDGSVQVEVYGELFPVRPGEWTAEFGDAVTALRSMNTSKQRRVEASIIVIETMLDAEDADAVYDRFHSHALDRGARFGGLLAAANELARSAHLPRPSSS